MNNLRESIPKSDLILENGNINPRLLEIFNEWFDKYSDSEERMTREFCGKFVKDVTNTQENIPVDDHRINFLFESYDLNKQNFIPREGFILFYTECLKNSEKLQIVWDNLYNMGIRNDLRKFEESIYKKNVTKYSLPRYKLSHYEEFFNTIFSLQDSSCSNIAKEAFEFLNVISTNPKIYKNILEANDSKDWKKLMDITNIYKLIYSLQIIESILEEVEIEKEGVDYFYNEEYILIEENQVCRNGDNLTEDNNIELKSNKSIVNIKVLKENKIEWMNNFVENEGFGYLIEVFNFLFKYFIYFYFFN